MNIPKSYFKNQLDYQSKNPSDYSKVFYGLEFPDKGQIEIKSIDQSVLSEYDHLDNSLSFSRFSPMLGQDDMIPMFEVQSS